MSSVATGFPAHPTMSLCSPGWGKECVKYFWFMSQVLKMKDAVLLEVGGDEKRVEWILTQFFFLSCFACLTPPACRLHLGHFSPLRNCNRTYTPALHLLYHHSEMGRRVFCPCCSQLVTTNRYHAHMRERSMSMMIATLAGTTHPMQNLLENSGCKFECVGPRW